MKDDQEVASPGREAQTANARGEQTANERGETQLERYDRNLAELMSELRVALPGVQVLFGFLLVIPFDNRFKSATGAERTLRRWRPHPAPVVRDPPAA